MDKRRGWSVGHRRRRGESREERRFNERKRERVVGYERQKGEGRRERATPIRPRHEKAAITSTLVIERKWLKVLLGSRKRLLSSTITTGSTISFTSTATICHRFFLPVPHITFLRLLSYSPPRARTFLPSIFVSFRPSLASLYVYLRARRTVLASDFGSVVFTYLDGTGEDRRGLMINPKEIKLA